MTEIQNKLIGALIKIEGGYVNDSSDSGGETRYGITKAVARSNNYYGEMRRFPRELAVEIYSKKYWNKLNLTMISGMAPEVAEEMFDTGVNLGTRRAGEFLQRSLNVFDSKANLVVDGAVGPATLKVLVRFIDKRGALGDKTLTKALDSLQGSFYITLAERRVKDKRFIFGWFSHRVS